jgi:hypothetical protein
VPETPIAYDNVEVLEHDDLGFTCRIGERRTFIGKYVPVNGTTVRRKGDRGRLTLPRWFVEQEGLPVAEHVTDAELQQWQARVRLKATTAQEYAEAHPGDAAAQQAVDRAMDEMAGAMLLKARRQALR